MIIIKNIDFIETDRDPYEILSTTIPYQPIHVVSNDGPETIDHTILRELIRGRRFRRPSDRKDMIIGVSEQAQDIIGIQYEAWDRLDEECQKWSDRCSYLTNENKAIKETGLWNRIKFVFTGIK